MDLALQLGFWFILGSCGSVTFIQIQTTAATKEMQIILLLWEDNTQL